MIKRKYIIKDELGLHARPAAKIVNKLKEFDADFTIKANDKFVNMSSIMMLLSLKLTVNKEFELTIDGKEEKKAMSTLEELFLEMNFCYPV